MKEPTRSGPGAAHPREQSSIAVRPDRPTDMIPRPKKTDVAAEEERRRTGRYLAVCLTLVMLVIACYHVLMRQMPVLVGLLAPAVIMILYLIWLLYFAMKRKRTEIALV